MREPSLGAAGLLKHDFPLVLQGAQFSGTAAGSAQKNQACGQREFWGLIFCTGFMECSSVLLLPGKLSLLASIFCYLWSSMSPGLCLHSGTGFPGILE
jgi:hypothetical protein